MAAERQYLTETIVFVRPLLYAPSLRALMDSKGLTPSSYRNVKKVLAAQSDGVFPCLSPINPRATYDTDFFRV